MIFFVIYLSRAPETLLFANLWAEDANVFFHDAFYEPSILTLFKPYAGYLHFIPRLTAFASTFLPIEYVATSFNLTASLLQLLPLAFVLSSRSDQLIPGWRLKLLVSFVYVCLPGASEAHGTVTNLQWTLPFLITLILFCEPPQTIVTRMVEWVGMFFVGLTGPISIFALGAYFLVSLRERKLGRWDIALVLFLCSFVHIYHLTGSDRLSVAISYNLQWLSDSYFVSSVKGFYNLFFGMYGFNKMISDSTLLSAWSLHLPSLLIFLSLLYLAVRKQHSLVLSLFLIAGAIVLAQSRIQPNPFSLLVSPFDAMRYFMTLQLSIAIALAYHLFDRSLLIKIPAAILFILVIFKGIPSDFRSHKARGALPSWAVQIRERYLPLAAEGKVFIDAYPLGWGVNLQKSDSLQNKRVE